MNADATRDDLHTKMLNALQRDLAFAANVRDMLKAIGLTDAVQYDIASSRLEELAPLVALARARQHKNLPSD